MVDDDGLSVFFIEANPYFESVAGGVVDLGRDEPEAIDFVAAIKVFS